MTRTVESNKRILMVSRELNCYITKLTPCSVENLSKNQETRIQS